MIWYIIIPMLLLVIGGVIYIAVRKPTPKTKQYTRLRTAVIGHISAETTTPPPPIDYTLADEEFTKLVVAQIMMNRSPTMSVSFANNAFKRYGCWDNIANKPRYTERATAYIQCRWTNSHDICQAETLNAGDLPEVDLRYHIFTMYLDMDHASQIISGTGPLKNELLRRSFTFNDANGEIETHYATPDLWDWGNFFGGFFFCLGILVQVLTACFTQRWDLIVSSIVAAALEIWGFCGGDQYITSDTLQHYLSFAEAAYGRYGTVTSVEAQAYIETETKTYVKDKYGYDLSF